MTVDDAAWRLRRKPEELRESLEFFESRGMISCNEKTISVTKFMDRQYDKPSDRPAETRKRKRRQREREAMSRECHADVTPSHAIDTEGDRERDTDTEGEGTASASSMELSILHELKGIDKYPFDYEKDLDYIRMLLVEFADVDILGEVKKWAVYKMDKPLKANSNARSQLRNWMTNARKFAEERRDRHGDHARHSRARGSDNTGAGRAARAGAQRPNTSDYTSGKYGGVFKRTVSAPGEDGGEPDSGTTC
ncbi:MAG: hypothetical protein WAO51_06720 [Bacillota bacterium]